jgi:hypothetical protein
MKHISTFENFLNEGNASMYKSTVQNALKLLGYDLKQSELKVGVKKEKLYDLITLNGELLCSSSDYAQMVTWIQNAVKEDPAKYGLDPRVLESEDVNEGDMTKDYDGFIVIDYKTKKNYKFRYIKGTNNVKVEDEAIAKLMKDTRQPRATFAVNGLVRKGEWDKSDAQVLESANEAKDMSYWKQYAEGHHSSPKWYNEEVKNASEIADLVDEVIKNDQAEAEIPFEIDAKDEKALVKMATDYFNQFKTINGNVISAMIFQGA